MMNTEKEIFHVKTIAFLLMMLLTTTTAWAWDGEGIEGDPYQIKTTADLDQLVERVISGTGDADAASGYNGVYFVLTKDIDASQLSAPNAPSSTPFRGHFDGQGHTIRSLSIQSLFDEIEGGTVKNLRIARSSSSLTSYDTIGFLCRVNKGGTLYNCEIDSCKLTISNGNNIAFLCSKNEEGTIDCCRVKYSFIDGAAPIVCKNIGGVCALNDRGVVSRCRVESLSIDDRINYNSNVENVGGICGKNYHGQLLNDTIERSHILLKVEKQYQSIGGICGLNGYTSDDRDEQDYAQIPYVIEKCISDDTTINAETSYNTFQKNIKNVGGIVGMCQGQSITLTDCHTLAGSITVFADNVGGICGRFINEGGDSYIRNCYNHADVKGSSYVGGVVGIMSGASMSEGQNFGAIRAAKDYEYLAEKPAGCYAGGIAGALMGQSSFTDCTNQGTVEADTCYVGGIVGALMEGSNIKGCSNSGYVRGIQQVGGLAGLICQNAWFEGQCANSGKVSGVAQVGGLVGYLKGVGAHTCRDSRNDAQKIFYASMGGGVYGYAEDSLMLENCSSTNIVRYESVIDIISRENILSFRQEVNNGNTYEGTLVRLNCNLEIDSDWEPIGKYPERPFRGIFDGLDHSIKYSINVNYPYNYDEEDYYYQGLFGYMEGTVRNLDLVDCSISADNSDYVGLVAGYCHGSILDCGSYAHYENLEVKGKKYVGGLVGMAYNSEIKNCYNGLNVSGKQYVGGIVGDFAANKNIATYGGMPYNLYVGNVNQCFNYGIVQSNGNSSDDGKYVGGIAGSTSTEVKHSYNSGIVNGEEYVGGIAGQLQGDSIYHCYNAGYLPKRSHQSAIVADCGPANTYSVYHCFYDKQMCSAEDVNATGLFTREMVAGMNYSSIRAALGDKYWTYNNNEYPSLTQFYKKYGIIVPISVKPLLLPGNMPVDDIVQGFAGATGNTSDTPQGEKIVWSHYGDASPTIDEEHIERQTGKDIIPLLSCGKDLLKVSYDVPAVQRLVPIVVTATDATVVNDSAFVSYTWNVNNETYTKSGFYTHYDEDSGKKEALNLTIAKVTIDQIKPTCGENANGQLTATVTSDRGNNFSNSLLYKWYNEKNDNIGNQQTLTDCLPGTYTLTITDAKDERLTYSEAVTLTPGLVKLSIAALSESKPYDGTALIGMRYVVTEEGCKPDTINIYSIWTTLSNNDKLEIKLKSGSITEVGSIEDAVVIESYSINTYVTDIDNSCHYEVTTAKGSLTVTPRPVTITAKANTIDCGDEPANNGVEYEGLCEATAEDITSLPLSYKYNTQPDGQGDDYTASSPAGTYYIIPYGLGDLPNYDITYVPNTLNVVPVVVLFAANSTNLWATFCDTYERMLPEGCTVYTINKINEGMVTFSPVETTTIPAYTPVMIQRGNGELTADIKPRYSADGTAPDDYNGIVSTAVEGATFWGNATYNAINEGGFTADGLTAYSLYNGRFYRIEGNPNINAHRCILTVGGNTNAPVLIINNGEATDISEMEKMRNAGNEAYYTLDGRRLADKPTQKGVYINGGKKVVVK